MEGHERASDSPWLWREPDRFPEANTQIGHSSGMIQDEEKWLAMLVSRNDVSHSYNEEIARALIERVKADYMDLLEELQKEIASHWL